MKNPQFLPESAETLTMLPIHEIVGFTKFHENWPKIVDFSLIAYFGPCLIFYSPVSRSNNFQKRLKIRAIANVPNLEFCLRKLSDQIAEACLVPNVESVYSVYFAKQGLTDIPFCEATRFLIIYYPIRRFAITMYERKNLKNEEALWYHSPLQTP